MQFAGNTLLNLANYSHQSVQKHFKNPHGIDDKDIISITLTLTPTLIKQNHSQRGIKISIIENEIFMCII